MKNLKYIFWYFKKYKKRYIIGITALLLVYVVIPIPNKLIGEFVDRVSNKTLDMNTLIFYSIILIGSIALQYVLQYIWHYFIFGHSFQSSRDSRRKLVAKILQQTPPFFYKNSTGSLMNKATQDVGTIEMLTGYGILAFSDATIYPISIILIMGFTISWPMTLISIILLPLLIIITKILGQKLHVGYLKLQKSYEIMNESVMENISSVRVIKGFSTQEVSSKRFEKAADDLYEDQFKQDKLHSLFIPSGRLIPSLTFIIALIFGQHLMSTGNLTLGQLTSFFLYLNMLVWPMFAFGDLVNVIQESSASLVRLQEIYDYKEDLVDIENPEEYQAKDSITFQNFSFKYPGDEKYSLKDINLKIKKGETLGIVGKIGSGKTTLLKQLLRFYDIEEGEILFDGKPAEAYSIKSIRDKMGYVPQQHLLFSKSVYDNIAFGKENATEEEVMDAIEFADFTKDLDTLPNGLETMIGEKGISISGGQKQRVSISRAIIKDPEILILDDSLSAVDSITEKRIIENIVTNRQGKTTIIVAHRLSGLKHAENIIVLDRGEIVESGTHEELIKNRGWYYSQYESQKSGGSDE
ncbi:ABC transporter ATP-binding protein [Helcococcus kunzii]|uniref:ABC transporter ATP-binding protein n=1 Tax=Helcococcus kunzii TaxID=40091 RepID=UPI0024AE3382|nr:ABC transporter ATP-binding protein [Helcococcus kunzii]